MVGWVGVVYNLLIVLCCWYGELAFGVYNRTTVEWWGWAGAGVDLYNLSTVLGGGGGGAGFITKSLYPCNCLLRGNSSSFFTL